MKLFNLYYEKFNIGHFQGCRNNSLYDENKEYYIKIFEDQKRSYENTKLTLPDDLTIITTFTNKEKAFCVKQLENNNIPYINAAEGFTGEWNMTYKIQFIVDALKKVTTKYTLIVDAYDVIFYTFDDIIEKFNQKKCGCLFNATKNNYPNIIIDKIPFRDLLGEYNRFNAGCCIGKTNDLVCFYNECIEFMQLPNYNNIYNSEQYVLRNVFAKYCEYMLLNNVPMKIDYNCDIFVCVGNSILSQIKDNDGKETDEYIMH